MNIEMASCHKGFFQGPEYFNNILGTNSHIKGTCIVVYKIQPHIAYQSLCLSIFLSFQLKWSRPLMATTEGMRAFAHFLLYFPSQKQETDIFVQVVYAMTEMDW